MPDPQRTAETLYDDEDEYRPEPEPIPQPPAWMDGGLRIGIHTSIATDIAESLDTARKLGCNALQIFSASPRMWGRPGTSRITEVDAKRFQKRRAELGLGPLVVHDNYLINLAATQPVLRVRSGRSMCVIPTTIWSKSLIALPDLHSPPSSEGANCTCEISSSD